MIKSFFLLNIFCFFYYLLPAQNNAKYENVDVLVTNLGKLDSMSIADISQKLTTSFSTKEMKARAIFTWIALNIDFDVKSQKRNPDLDIDPMEILKKRAATSKGFASLFQEMCSQSNIRCMVINGYTQIKCEDINNPSEEPNHYWNMIQLGNSNEQWYFVDVVKASGYLDNKQTIFIKSFNGNYFFPAISLFYQDHFPKNSAWLFGNGPKNLKDFYSLPIIGSEAYAINMNNNMPSKGLIHAKINAPVSFSFKYDYKPLDALYIIYKSGSKQSKPERINFDEENGVITFSYTFKKEDEISFTVIHNDRPIISYQIEISE